MDDMRITDGEMTAAGDICVMGDEPYPDGTPEDVRAWYREHPGEKGLAKAYADAANEFGWLALDVDDFDAGTPGHEAALGTVLKWMKLADELVGQILQFAAVIIDLGDQELKSVLFFRFVQHLFTFSS